MNKIDKLERIKNLKSTENGIVVVGIPKAGSHLCMGILDALGIVILDYLWNNYFVVIFQSGNSNQVQAYILICTYKSGFYF